MLPPGGVIMYMQETDDTRSFIKKHPVFAPNSERKKLGLGQVVGWN